MKNADPVKPSSHPSLVIAIFLLSWISASVAQAQNTPDPYVQRDLEMLGFVKKKISENYYDKNYRGVDLDAKFESCAEKLKKSRADRESLIVIAEAVMELDDSHTVFHPPILKQRADYGWTMKIVGDSCFVTEVKPQSDAEKQGLKVGDIVLSINGAEPSRGNLWKVKYFYTRLNPQNEHVMQLIVQAPKGKPRSVSIAARLEKNSEGSRDKALKLHKQTRERNLEMIRKVSDEIILWKIPRIAHYENEDITQILELIKGYKKLILDLRGNPGGSAELTSSILSCLFSQKIRAYDRKDRKKVSPVWVNPHRKGAFNGALVALVDSETRSGAEVVARLIQLEKRGVVIGDRTAGGVMLSDTFYNVSPSDLLIKSTPPIKPGLLTAYGIQVSVAELLMPDGQSLERVGVSPDELLLPKPEDIANKRDPVLARAAAILGANIDPEKAGALLESLLSNRIAQPK